MRRVKAAVLAVALAGFVPAMLLAQGTQVAFGGLSHDTTLPIEITSDRLTVNQADGSATFVGHVVIGQGEMRLSAGEVRVEYASGSDSTGQIRRLLASGGATLVNGAEAAEANEAVYTIETGVIILTGNVILTQGRNAMSADRLIVNLKQGTGTMEGRVKTILQADN